MSTSMPPLEPGATALPLGGTLADESALRAVFLAEYPTISAEANKELGEHAATLSPKVVEGAFVRAWDARSRLANMDQLHHFLIEDVHHAAARALSRRVAAHRLAGHEEYTPHVHRTEVVDAEQSWARIVHALHGEAHSPQALAAEAAVSRHQAAEHIAGISKDNSLRVALIVGIPAAVIVTGLVLWMNHLGVDSQIANALNAPDVRLVTSQTAQVGNLTLDDGSTVRLAPESKLTIPAKFGPEMRAVKLEGSASINVAKGQSSDLQVRAGDAIIVAKGTSFTVRAYPGDGAVTVAVTEGAVEVRQGTESHPLAAGAALYVPQGAPARPASASERDAADGWRTGVLSITNRPLREVLPQLKRWYGLDVRVQQEKLLTRPVTMRASLDSSRAAIRGIEESTGLQFGYIDQTMVFKEPSAASARRK